MECLTVGLFFAGTKKLFNKGNFIKNNFFTIY